MRKVWAAKIASKLGKILCQVQEVMSLVPSLVDIGPLGVIPVQPFPALVDDETKLLHQRSREQEGRVSFENMHLQMSCPACEIDR